MSDEHDTLNMSEDPRTAATPVVREVRVHRSLHVEIGWKTFASALLVVGGAWLLVQIWPITLVVVVGLMIAGALSPAVSLLERRGLPRWASITLVFSTIFVCAAGFIAFTIPRIGDQMVTIAVHIPSAMDDVVDLLQQAKVTRPLANSMREANAGNHPQQLGALLIAYTPRVVETIAYAVTSCFLALYLVIDRDRMRGGIFSLVPRTFHLRLSRILLKLETIVGGYVRGQLITSILMSIFTFLVLSIARAPNALALAAFAGVADVLPYIGGILACGPAIVAALTKSTEAGIAVGVALVFYQEFESRVIVPRVYGDALRLPSTVVLVSLLIGGTLLGIIGALLALPIAAAIRMLVDELQFELPGEEAAALTQRRFSADELSLQRRAAGESAEKSAEIATEIAAKELRAEDSAPSTK